MHMWHSSPPGLLYHDLLHQAWWGEGGKLPSSQWTDLSSSSSRQHIVFKAHLLEVTDL